MIVHDVEIRQADGRANVRVEAKGVAILAAWDVGEIDEDDLEAVLARVLEEAEPELAHAVEGADRADDELAADGGRP